MPLVKELQGVINMWGVSHFNTHLSHQRYRDVVTILSRENVNINWNFDPNHTESRYEFYKLKTSYTQCELFTKLKPIKYREVTDCLYWVWLGQKKY
jgi:hypothetical protein